MYSSFLIAHSIARWLVLLLLLYAIFRSFIGYAGNRGFSKTDNALRHWTATMAHIQLMIGMIVYMKSPLVKAFWKDQSTNTLSGDFKFFSVIHIALMFVAIIVLTIGSAMAKRQKTDKQKFRTMLIWFIFALLIILIAIPWPFSPLAQRLLIRL